MGRVGRDSDSEWNEQKRSRSQDNVALIHGPPPPPTALIRSSLFYRKLMTRKLDERRDIEPAVYSRPHTQTSLDGRSLTSANVCHYSMHRRHLAVLIFCLRTLGICFTSNYTILQLAIPDNPSKPCLSCTKQWCLNQNLPICAGATLGDTNMDTASGKEGDVEARCFRTLLFLSSGLALTYMSLAERDSPRDQLVVVLFLLTVFGLLLGVGIKGKMHKAGIDPHIPWDSGRRWWDVSYSSLHSDIGANNGSFAVSQEWQPRRQIEELGLSRFTNGRPRHADEQEVRNGEYTAVFEAPPSP